MTRGEYLSLLVVTAMYLIYGWLAAGQRKHWWVRALIAVLWLPLWAVYGFLAMRQRMIDWLDKRLP